MVDEGGYLEARRGAAAKYEATLELILGRVDEINRLLAPFGLRYNVRSIRAE